MKKFIYLLIACVALVGCVATYNTQVDNLDRLTIGMTKAEVASWIGPPQRTLSVIQNRYGDWEEILQYRNVYGEIFALEFINNSLVSANYIYDSGWYPMYPPTYIPPYGGPVFPPSYKPHKPAPKPPGTNHPHKPTPRPPVNNNNRPQESLRPSEPVQSSGGNRQPSQGNTNNRPNNNNNNNNSGQSSSQSGNRRQSTSGSNNSSGNNNSTRENSSVRENNTRNSSQRSSSSSTTNRSNTSTENTGRRSK